MVRWLHIAVLVLPLALAARADGYTPRLLWTRPLRQYQTPEGQGGWLIVRPPVSFAGRANASGTIVSYDAVPGEPSGPEGAPVTGVPWDLTVLRPDTGQTVLALHGCYGAYRASGDTFLAARRVGRLGEVTVEAWSLQTGKLIGSAPASDAHVSRAKGFNPSVTFSAVSEGVFYFADDNGFHRFDLSRKRVVRSWPVRRYEYDYNIADANFVVRDRFYYNSGHTIGIMRMADYPHGWWHAYATNLMMADEQGAIGTGGLYRAIVSFAPRGKLYFDASEVRDRLFWTVEDDYTPAYLRGRTLVVGANLFREIPVPHARPGDDDRKLLELSKYLVAFDRFTGHVPWKVPMLADSYAIYGDRVAVMAGHRKQGHMQYRLEAYDLQGHRLWRGDQAWGWDKQPTVVPAGDGFALVTGSELRCYR